MHFIHTLTFTYSLLLFCFLFRTFLFPLCFAHAGNAGCIISCRYKHISLGRQLFDGGGEPPRLYCESWFMIHFKPKHMRHVFRYASIQFHNIYTHVCRTIYYMYITRVFVIAINAISAPYDSCTCCGSIALRRIMIPKHTCGKTLWSDSNHFYPWSSSS